MSEVAFNCVGFNKLQHNIGLQVDDVRAFCQMMIIMDYKSCSNDLEAVVGKGVTSGLIIDTDDRVIVTIGDLQTKLPISGLYTEIEEKLYTRILDRAAAMCDSKQVDDSDMTYYNKTLLLMKSTYGTTTSIISKSFTVEGEDKCNVYIFRTLKTMVVKYRSAVGDVLLSCLISAHQYLNLANAGNRMVYMLLKLTEDIDLDAVDKMKEDAQTMSRDILKKRDALRQTVVDVLTEAQRKEGRRLSLAAADIRAIAEIMSNSPKFRAQITGGDVK